MQLAELMADLPTIHGHNRWRLDDDTLKLLDRTLRPQMRTIETGCGVSTILFALRQTHHTCIVPDQQQIERIRDYCQTHGISLDSLTFIVASSHEALPTLPEEIFDLALIDGGHGFPMPFLDWYYLAPRLTIGGTIIIDDLHIWTCSLLVRFLAEEPGWQVVWETLRAAAIRKRADWSPKEWPFQPFVKRHSRATSVTAKIEYAWYLLRSGKYSLLLRDIAGRIGLGR